MNVHCSACMLLLGWCGWLWSLSLFCVGVEKLRGWLMRAFWREREDPVRERKLSLILMRAELMTKTHKTQASSRKDRTSLPAEKQLTIKIGYTAQQLASWACSAPQDG